MCLSLLRPPTAAALRQHRVKATRDAENLLAAWEFVTMNTPWLSRLKRLRRYTCAGGALRSVQSLFLTPASRHQSIAAYARALARTHMRACVAHQLACVATQTLVHRCRPAWWRDTQHT